jgi:hypothetical protein
MSDPQERDDDRDENEHPLESPESLRDPRDTDDEQHQSSQPVVTPDLDRLTDDVGRGIADGSS